MPARPRRPRDKAKVEVGVQVVERWILAALRHRPCFSLAELNQAIRELLTRLNQRPFKRQPDSRQTLFLTQEQPALRPLPTVPYEFAEWKKTFFHKVNIEFKDAIKAKELRRDVSNEVLEVMKGRLEFYGASIQVAEKAKDNNLARLTFRYATQMANNLFLKTLSETGKEISVKDMINAFLTWVESFDCGIDLLQQQHYREPK